MTDSVKEDARRDGRIFTRRCYPNEEDVRAVKHSSVTSDTEVMSARFRTRAGVPISTYQRVG